MQPTRLMPQEQAIMVYFVTADEGTTIDDVLKPTYWAHVTRGLLPGHEIKVMCADGSWWAHLLVRSAGATQATVHKMNYIEFKAAPSVDPQESPFTTKYRGPQHMHCVIRKDNGAVERTNFATNDDAVAWIAAQAKAVAA